MNNNDQYQKKLSDIPVSVLDLAAILEGKTPADTFKNSADLAQHAELWGFKRYWLAEHHSMESIASSPHLCLSAISPGKLLPSGLVPEALCCLIIRRWLLRSNLVHWNLYIPAELI